MRGSASRNSGTYGCQAEHQSFAYPTDRRQAKRSLRFCVPNRHQAPTDAYNSDDDDDDDDDDTEQMMAQTDETEEELEETEDYSRSENIQKLVKQNKALREQLRRAHDRITRLERQFASVTQTAGSSSYRQQRKAFSGVFKEEVQLALEAVLVRKPFCNWGTKRISSLVASAIWNFRDGLFQQSVTVLVKKWLSKTDFHPFNVLRAMDFAGGTLSYEGIEVLRQVETRFEKYVRGTVIPCSAELRRCAALVEAYGNVHVPFQISQTPQGEMFTFDLKKTVPFILSAHCLDNAAHSRSICVAQSIDGMQLSKNISMTAAGIKMNDLAACCPFTKKPFASQDAAGKQVIRGFQSRNACFPLQIQIGKETQESFKNFQSLFKFFDECKEEETNHFANKGIKPLKVHTNCDLASTWRGLCLGGGAKTCDMMCHCCQVRDSELVEENPNKCARWCQELHQDRPEWKCYHRDIDSESDVIDWVAEAEELKESIAGELEHIRNYSKISSDNAAQATRDSQSIFFEPRDNGEIGAYNRLLTNELILRQIDFLACRTWVERRQLLKEQLDVEKRLDTLLRQIERFNEREAAAFAILSCIPCILHCENRVSLKIFTMLLIKGLSNAKAGRTFTDLSSEKARMDAFIGAVESTINTKMLGTEESPSEWRIPLSDDRKEIGTVTMANERVREVVDKVELLLDICLSTNDDADDHPKWVTAVTHYRLGMKEMRRHEDFEPEEVLPVQKNLDLFYSSWVDLWGREGITNYIHMLGTGHMADYLLATKNLYRHSQQGWENLNHLLKTFFFRRTARGGAGNQGQAEKNRIKPVARWLQRRLIFACGYTYEQIKRAVDEQGVVEQEGEDNDIHELDST